MESYQGFLLFDKRNSNRMLHGHFRDHKLSRVSDRHPEVIRRSAIAHVLVQIPDCDTGEAGEDTELDANTGDI
jgi:hypothetical protein